MPGQESRLPFWTFRSRSLSDRGMPSVRLHDESGTRGKIQGGRSEQAPFSLYLWPGGSWSPFKYFSNPQPALPWAPFPGSASQGTLSIAGRRQDVRKRQPRPGAAPLRRPGSGQWRIQKLKAYHPDLISCPPSARSLPARVLLVAPPAPDRRHPPG